MVSRKEINEFFKNHKKLGWICGTALGIIIAAIMLATIFQGAAIWDNHLLSERAKTVGMYENSGLVAPNFVASSNLTKTIIYSLNDPECGFALTLVVSDWGMNPPASINGKRIKKITALPQIGFKLISGPIAKNSDTVPEVCRYVNLSRNEVIYYAYGRGASCRFDLFENVNST
jgi:hypothetical protein